MKKSILIMLYILCILCFTSCSEKKKFEYKYGKPLDSAVAEVNNHLPSPVLYDDCWITYVSRDGFTIVISLHVNDDRDNEWNKINEDIDFQKKFNNDVIKENLMWGYERVMDGDDLGADSEFYFAMGKLLRCMVHHDSHLAVRFHGREDHYYYIRNYDSSVVGIKE